MGGERERMPRLTVMEEVLLLGLKDKQVSLVLERRSSFEVIFVKDVFKFDGRPGGC